MALNPRIPEIRNALDEDAVVADAREVGCDPLVALAALRQNPPLLERNAYGGLTPAARSTNRERIRALYIERPDAFKPDAVAGWTPAEKLDIRDLLMARGLTREAERFQKEHYAAIQVASAVRVREDKARLAESQRRERAAHAQSEAVAKAKRKAADLAHVLEVVEKGGEWPWNGMGKPPSPPNLREVADLREKVKEAKLAVAVLEAPQSR